MGRDPFLNKSLIGGDPIEGYPVHGIWVEDEALDRGDALHEESKVGREAIEEDNGAADNIQDLDDLYTQATTPVYEGSYTSIVSTTIIIMNMCIVFHVSNKFSDELFRFLSTDLLPVGNKLPHTHYEARKSIRRLGLHYNNVHACPNGCILFEDDYAPCNTCPKCNTSRWLDGSNRIPSKVIRHFPSFQG